MTLHLRAFVVLSVVGSWGLAGCGSSDKDDTPVPNSLLTERTAFLTQSAWVQTRTSMTDNNNGVITHHHASLLNAAPCVRDNTMNFHADQTYVNDEGPIRCSPTDPQTLTAGTWALEADGSELTLARNQAAPQAAPARWKIVRLTASEYILTRTLAGNGLNATHIDTITFHAL